LKLTEDAPEEAVIPDTSEHRPDTGDRESTRPASPHPDKPEHVDASSRRSASAGAKPITSEVLRAKLDAAIVAEAWEAVKAIRERIVEIERAGVVDLDAERARRGR
jgi:hypothetical protein